MINRYNPAFKVSQWLKMLKQLSNPASCHMLQQHPHRHQCHMFHKQQHGNQQQRPNPQLTTKSNMYLSRRKPINITHLPSSTKNMNSPTMVVRRFIVQTKDQLIILAFARMEVTRPGTKATDISRPARMDNAISNLLENVTTIFSIGCTLMFADGKNRSNCCR